MKLGMTQTHRRHNIQMNQSILILEDDDYKNGKFYDLIAQVVIRDKIKLRELTRNVVWAVRAKLQNDYEAGEILGLDRVSIYRYRKQLQARENEQCQT